jgi:hypothetical protein
MLVLRGGVRDEGHRSRLRKKASTRMAGIQVDGVTTALRDLATDILVATYILDKLGRSERDQWGAPCNHRDP